MRNHYFTSFLCCTYVLISSVCGPIKEFHTLSVMYKDVLGDLLEIKRWILATQQLLSHSMLNLGDICKQRKLHFRERQPIDLGSSKKEPIYAQGFV